LVLVQNTPTGKLNIYNPGNPTKVTIGNSNTASGGFTSLQFGTSADANGYVYLQGIQASGSTYGNVVLNQSGGNVGIGNANPQRLLI